MLRKNVFINCVLFVLSTNALSQTALCNPRIEAEKLPSNYLSLVPSQYTFVISEHTQEPKILGIGYAAHVFLVKNTETHEFFAAKIYHPHVIQNHYHTSVESLCSKDANQAQEWEKHLANSMTAECFNGVLVKSLVSGSTLRDWLVSGKLFSGNEESELAVKKLKELIKNHMSKRSFVNDLSFYNLMYDENRKTWVIVDGYMWRQREYMTSFNYYKKRWLEDEAARSEISFGDVDVGVEVKKHIISNLELFFTEVLEDFEGDRL